MNKTILVVEDERPLAHAIRLKLEDAGFIVVTARTVEEALAQTKALETLDAIWLDHYLIGKENGLDFVAALKSAEGRLQHIPICVVSNTAGPDKMQSYMHLGINKYYVKAEYKLADIINDIIVSIQES